MMGFFNHETLIERLARESGYLLAEREGDRYTVRADDHTAPRYIHIRCRDDQAYALFHVVFPARFPVSAISSNLLMGLLMRNREVFFGRWCTNVVESCEVSLTLHYSAIKAGLTPGMFTVICREMVGESESLHDKLRKQVAQLDQVALAPARPVIRHQATGNVKLPYVPGKGITWKGD